MTKKALGILLTSAFVLTAFSASSLSARQAATSGQTEKIDATMNAKITSEGMDRSKLMWIEHFLADVYGPRPIGSPNHVAAANWALKTMTSWGMKNAHLSRSPGAASAGCPVAPPASSPRRSRPI